MAQRIEQIFAVTAPGLESVCAAELRQSVGVHGQVEPGGVAFSGGPRELYLANLWLRSASRILVRVGEVTARDFPSFHRKTLQLPWGRYLRSGVPLQVRASSKGSRLVHTGRIAETLVAAIKRTIGSADPKAGVAEQLLIARMEDDRCLLSIDSSGELLHRRGYRTDGAQAPLRETLAAGILQLLGWDGMRPLLDPLCGSGTFLIEAALLAANQAPGSERDFAFTHWPHFRAGAWQLLCDEAQRGVRSSSVVIVGSDRDADSVAAARANAKRAGCARMIDVHCHDFADLRPPAGPPGLILCNPPYGLRVGGEGDLRPFYQRLGAVWRQQFSGWQVALFCPAGPLPAATGLPLQPVAELRNGGLPVTLFSCQL
jgi:putative N6-adenine-specific DNA methylase